MGEINFKTIHIKRSIENLPAKYMIAFGYKPAHPLPLLDHEGEAKLLRSVQSFVLRVVTEGHQTAYLVVLVSTRPLGKALFEKGPVYGGRSFTTSLRR